MEAADVLKMLEESGTEQNRKTYRRHGADEDVFGVSYAKFKDFKKLLKTNQPLAEDLWDSGNHDARVLATMIADPKTIGSATLDAWSRSLTNHVLAGALAGLAAQTPDAVGTLQRWMASKTEWIAACGWDTLANLAVSGKAIDRKLLEDRMATIERTIHSAPNRVRHSMNGVLIAIALIDDDLEQKAKAIATKIGKVVVDHGDTGCKTPDAISYIEKALARKNK